MIPLLSSSQLRAADAHTIQQGDGTSLELMERAAARCVDRLLALLPADAFILVVAGMGNNGGDGLAMARQLHELGRRVRVIVVRHREHGTLGFQVQWERATEVGVPVTSWALEDPDPEFQADLLVDAMLGTGQDRPLSPVLARMVDRFRDAGLPVVAIDRPTGWGGPDDPGKVVRATHTFVLATMEPRMLLPDRAELLGTVHVLPIGLDPLFLAAQSTDHHWIEASDIRSLLPRRPRTGHKGTFGHALLIAGGPGKLGAAVLAARAALHSGVGLITLRVPSGSEQVVHVSVPEVLVSADPEPGPLSSWLDLASFSAVGIGPGIGTGSATATILKRLIQEAPAPLVLDADALNLLALQPTWLHFLPAGSILTPHPKEFDRLAGPSRDPEERLAKARELARRIQAVIVLKGAPTATCLPDGRVVYNSSGNEGMAKGGSGDALTGIITALRAQGLGSVAAALVGVYVHGAAGDLAAHQAGSRGMSPSDLLAALPVVWSRLERGDQNS